MQRERIPEGAEVVRTYCQYESLVEAFFDARYNLFVVIGKPGLAKSHSFEQRLSETSHLIRGWAAPLQSYMDCYLHRNKLLIFDDAEALWKRPGGRVLLRSLCEHRERKLLQWTSTASALKKAGIPQSFATSSKVGLIANRFVFGGQDEYAAIADRAHLIYFDPSPVEIHVRVSKWFWNQEVFDFVGDRLHLLDNVSSRLYLKAWERRQAGGDWKKLIEESFCLNHTLRIVQALESDPTCKSVENRVRRFSETTGACRATYFNLKRRLSDHQQLCGFEKLQVPKLQLRGEVPPQTDLQDEVARARAESESPEVLGADTDFDPADFWKQPPENRETNRGNESSPARGDQSQPYDALAERLRRELERAIQREDYERAAHLRDQIRRIADEAE